MKIKLPITFTNAKFAGIEVIYTLALFPCVISGSSPSTSTSSLSYFGNNQNITFIVGYVYIYILIYIYMYVCMYACILFIYTVDSTYTEPCCKELLYLLIEQFVKSKFVCIHINFLCYNKKLLGLL